METLPLIDVSLEDDLLISSSENSDGRNCSVLEPANASEGEILVKMSKHLDYMTEMSKSPEQKQAKSGKVNLRKSLAWDSAFFTSEGVLNTEELAIVHHMPEMSESPEQKQAKSGKVNLRKSLAWDSAFSTGEGVLNTEELAIVHHTFRKSEACSLPRIQEELRKSTESASTLDSESYALENLEGDLFNVRASIQMSVSKHDDCLSSERNASQLGSRKKVGLSCQNKIKPPSTLKRYGVSKQRLECTSKEGVIGGKEVAKGSENPKLSLKPPRVVHKPSSLLTVPNNKDSSGSVQMKNNAKRTPAGNVANRQGTVAFSTTAGDSRGMTSRSFSLPKPSHLNTMVFSSKSALQNNDQSSSGTTARRTPLRTSKSKIGPSSFKFSSKAASPSSSIDSFVSEGSSSPCTSIKPSNSVESLYSTPSSPSIVPTDKPCIKKDHVISSINGNARAKSFTPSGLRMPSPKIGYFDAEKTLVSKDPNKFSKIGVRGSLVKGNAGANDDVATNKLKSRRIPSLRPAARAQSAVLPPQKENTSPSYETNGSIRKSPSGGQKTSAVDIMDEKMSALSLSETTESVAGD